MIGKLEAIPRFKPAVTPPAELPPAAYWFLFRGHELLIHQRKGSDLIPCLANPAELGLGVVRQQYLGQLDDIPCFSAELPSQTEPPAGMTFAGLRDLFAGLTDDFIALASRAVQVVAWDRDHQFCSRCGRPTETLPQERAKQCPHCGLTTYPRLSPCIIVAIRNGDKILLARNHRFPDGFYSVVAGFVEPGETLEQALEREVAEEVGVRVTNIRYFGSQPWPFPNSLMMGFTADYASGEITLEEAEIADAAWFAADNLPKIPPPISIARRLIEAFIAEVANKK